MKKKVIRIIILSLSLIAELFYLGFCIIGCLIFFGDPDPSVPPAFVAIMGALALSLIAVTIAGFVRTFQYKKSVLLTGFFMKLWWLCTYLGLAFIPLDVDGIGATVLFLMISLVMLLLALWIRYIRRHGYQTNWLEVLRGNKGGAQGAPYSQQGRFYIVKAKWCYDEALAEYCEMYSRERSDLDDREQEKIWEYAGLWLGYMMTWLIRHDLHNETYEQQVGESVILGVKEQRITPLDLLVYNDYCLAADDISKTGCDFLTVYLENERYERTVGYYWSDYLAVISQYSGRKFCVDFDWGIYQKLEKRMDLAYHYYQIMDEESDSIESGSAYVVRTIKWEQMKASLEIFASPGVEEMYMDRCVAQILAMSEQELLTMGEVLLEKMYVPDGDEPGSPEQALHGFVPDAVHIFRPYGEEPAYVIAGEAEYEEEHGIAVMYFDGRIKKVGYRMDLEYESPWGKMAMEA